MEKKLKIGIIGCGGIANTKHLPALSQIPEVELVAFCDLKKERAVAAAEKYGTPDAGVYTDYHELLAVPAIDVVHVLTPNKGHAPISIDALRAGKHVMCEKPMAKTAAEARAMVDAAKETGKKLTIGYQLRQKPASAHLKKIVQRGDLGEVYFAKACAVRRRGTPTWGVFTDIEEQGGGPLIDIATHSLDLTLYLMDNYKPRMVVGTTYKKITDPDCANPWGPWDPAEHTVEDSAFGFIVMQNGCTIMLESSWSLNTTDLVMEGSCTLCGDKAGAQIKGEELSINKDEFGKLVEIHPDMAPGGVAYYDAELPDAGDLEARQWIDALLNDTDPCVLPEQACVISEILEAIYKSAATGAPVYFD